MKKFISDTHLGHKRIIEFERTRFKTIEEHDEFIKRLIIENVRKDDELYILGDVGLLDENNISFWNSLKCKTICIRGNHDNQKGKLLRAFNVVSDVPLFLSNRILLSHKPFPVTEETLNVHGHLHNYKMSKRNYMNINIHQIGYRLVTEKELYREIMNIPKISHKFKEEWYKDLYEEV